MDTQGLQERASSTTMIGPRCVGTCQVQKSAYPPCVVECQAIFWNFYVFYEKQTISIRVERGALCDMAEVSISVLWRR